MALRQGPEDLKCNAKVIPRFGSQNGSTRDIRMQMFVMSSRAILDKRWIEY